MTWLKNIEAYIFATPTLVHRLVDDITNEILAEIDIRGNVLFADRRAIPMLGQLAR